MIFDLHCDTIWKISEREEKGEYVSLVSNDLCVDQEKLLNGNFFAMCFAIYIPNKYENPFERCVHGIDVYYDRLAKCDKIAPVLSFSDFEKNRELGKISSVLTMEDGCPIGKDLSKLDYLYDRGVRMICLLHNLVNEIGYPNYGKYNEKGVPDYVTPNPNQGLTDFGVQLVQAMNEKGIVIDVSHLSDGGFYDVIKYSKKPIMASHSNARAVCGSIRNLTDDMLYKLADNGGATGMNYAKGFMSSKGDGDQTVKWVIEHVKYIKNLIGIDHVALGSDFDGVSPDIELSDASKMGLLVKGLDRAGFTTTEIEKVCYKNALRVFKAYLK